MITSEQVRAARAMLRLEQAELAEKAGVSVETIRRVEKSTGILRSSFESSTRIQRCLEMEGIVFGENNSVRLESNIKYIIIEELSALVSNAVSGGLHVKYNRKNLPFSDYTADEIADELLRHAAENRLLIIQGIQKNGRFEGREE